MIDISPFVATKLHVLDQGSRHLYHVLWRQNQVFWTAKSQHLQCALWWQTIGFVTGRRGIFNVFFSNRTAYFGPAFTASLICFVATIQGALAREVAIFTVCFVETNCVIWTRKTQHHQSIFRQQNCMFWTSVHSIFNLLCGDKTGCFGPGGRIISRKKLNNSPLTCSRTI